MRSDDSLREQRVRRTLIQIMRPPLARSEQTVRIEKREPRVRG
jgi:hypothetical protein